MPRITRSTVAAAIAALPFAPERKPTDATAYEALAPAMQAAIAKQIAEDRANGLSGDDMRAKYSGPGCPTNRGLSGPMRRKVLREHGYGSAVARSYSTYSDGESRSGSAHARMHGPAAVERQAQALAAVEAEAKAAASASKPAASKGKVASKPAAKRTARKRTPRKPAAKKAS